MSERIAVGQLVGVFGIKGWLKVKSNTEPAQNIINYQPWYLKTQHGLKQVEVDEHAFRPQGLMVHIKGYDDRDQAAALGKATIVVDKALLPVLEEQEYYWHQLLGLKVVSVFDSQNNPQSPSTEDSSLLDQCSKVSSLDAQITSDQNSTDAVLEVAGVEKSQYIKPQYLGTVKSLLETGANDVLVIAPDDQSIDSQERLVPYLPGEFVLSVDLDAGEIQVNWDPDF